MVFPIRLFIVLILFNSIPMILMAKEIKYNHNCITIPEIKKKVDFTVLTPKKIPDDWTLDTKTSPWLMLHYMDSKDTKLMVAIDLRKGFRISDDDFPHRQQVDINGNKGYFQEWEESGEVDKNGDTITGGLLNWVQDGTYVEMNSSRLPKEKMLEFARSMD
ncbi:DUF4367 domain-containing protein [Neobacillus sp. MER 74]|uniref:DUF4367 domain-containing protein n=1 Tax=Neobacillus sp. MER 74 TaxID=2939566 RepID=UPI00203B05E5|nr:DUF4367 domain-containing protein [Neobacillus sp. MER 74]MCM3118858.1 DUF4367 domain-containing protein [Neobacillus sp. MER 74]